MGITVEEKVKQVIAGELGISTDKIKPESRLRDDLGADSLDLAEIVIEIEDDYDIEISEEEAERVNTVQQAVDLISSKLCPR